MTTNKNTAAFKQIAALINGIKYLGEPTEKHLEKMQRTPKHVAIDWNNILPVPPPNDSKVTRQELQHISDTTKSVGYDEFDLIYEVDEDPADLFRPYLKLHGLKFPEQELKDVHKNSLDPISLNLKWKYQRPRPAQLAQKFNIEIHVINTTTHHTPAYPSGHAAYAGLLANMLSDLYPEHDNEFNELASLVGYARVLQGVHYPSDNSAGLELAYTIWQNIKHNVFPNLKTKGAKNATTNKK